MADRADDTAEKPCHTIRPPRSGKTGFYDGAGESSRTKEPTWPPLPPEPRLPKRNNPMQRILDWLGLPLFPSRSRLRRATASPRRAASHGRRLLLEELQSRPTPSTAHLGGTHEPPHFITAHTRCIRVL